MGQLRAGGSAFEVPGRFDSPVPWTPPPAQLTVRRPDRDGQAVVIADPQKLTSSACEIPRWIIGGSSSRRGLCAGDLGHRRLRQRRRGL